MWLVHERAQNLYFALQNRRSHAHRLLLEFLNKHVMTLWHTIYKSSKNIGVWIHLEQMGNTMW